MSSPTRDESSNTLAWQFELSPEQRAIQEEAERFFFAEFHPLQARMDAEDWLPEDAYPKLGAMGWLGLTASPEVGGAGLDYLTAALVYEALARANPALAFSVIGHDNLCLDNLNRNGTEDQRRRYVSGLARGELIGALGMTEPGAGSDALGSMRTTARRDGESYVLNGTKLYITNAPVADVVLVYAKTDPGAGTRGISAFIVEKGFPGFRVAQRLDKMGYRGSPLGELVFEDCRVPAENLLGAENEGARIMMSGLDVERAMATPLCLGTASRALELAIEHARTREQFGRPIGSFQMIQAKLAEMYAALEAARSFAWRTLAACSRMPLEEAGRGEIHKLTAAALFNAARASSFVLDEAAQIHGGMAYIRETEINRLYRTGKIMEIAAGTQEIRRLIVAKELLGL